MESEQTKKTSILKPASVINWALQVHPRFDETRKSILQLALDPPRRSLAIIHAKCVDLAYRRKTIGQAIDECSGFDGYLRMAADELIPAFDDYVTENQIVGLPDFEEDRYPFPIGKLPNGKTNFLRCNPSYVRSDGGLPSPEFIVGWAKVDLSELQKRLISSILMRAILTRQDFLGSDGRIVTFARDKWDRRRRLQGGWRISHYADMGEDELSGHLDRYNKALTDVFTTLEAAGYEF